MTMPRKGTPEFATYRRALDQIRLLRIDTTGEWNDGVETLEATVDLLLSGKFVDAGIEAWLLKGRRWYPNPGEVTRWRREFRMQLREALHAPTCPSEGVTFRFASDDGKNGAEIAVSAFDLYGLLHRAVTILDLMRL